jgi:hypothetical protein
MTPWQKYYFNTLDGYGSGYSLDFNQLFLIPQIDLNYKQYKKEETKMQDKFDQIVNLRLKKQDLEKQLSKYLLDISYDERDLKELKKAMDHYYDHIKMMKESYLKTSQSLVDIDQKLKDLHK